MYVSVSAYTERTRHRFWGAWNLALRQGRQWSKIASYANVTLMAVIWKVEEEVQR